MNDQSRFRAVALALFAVAVAAAIAVGAYNMGVAHGVATDAKIVAPPAGTPYVYVYPRPWGFGFGFFPILFVLFGFFVLRRLFWRGAWRGDWQHRCGHHHEPAQPSVDGTT